MGLRETLKPKIQDWVMRILDDLRPDTVGEASGDVLEVGFGTARNLEHYPPGVKSLTGLDPLVTEGVDAVEERIAAASFPVTRSALRADGRLPFDTGRFDTVLTTWTLCSIPDPEAALLEMRRVLKPGGRYLFVEHGRSERASTARWQDRVDPIWTRIADGCHINRRIDLLVAQVGFELERMDRFRGRGPGLLNAMYRGVATKA